MSCKISIPIDVGGLAHITVKEDLKVLDVDVLSAKDISLFSFIGGHRLVLGDLALEEEVSRSKGGKGLVREIIVGRRIF